MTIYKCLMQGQKHLFARLILGQKRPARVALIKTTRPGRTAWTPSAVLAPEDRHPGLAFVQARYCVNSPNLTTIVNETKLQDCIEFSCNDAREIFKEDFNLYNNFISESEAESIMKEVRKHFKGLRYEVDHWDDAIHGYRETEKSNWNEENFKIIQRVHDSAFDKSNYSCLNLVHVLDLAEDGYIKPHIDSVKFCGNVIAGVSLLSPSVMKLVHEKHKNIWADVLLQPCSLYVLRDRVRYEFTHEILPNETSSFREQKVQKTRRISVICRNTVET